MIDLDGVPFPVAYPFHYACDDTLPFSDRVENLIVTAGQALRTTALLLAAEYVAGDSIDSVVTEALRALQVPHWSDWSRAADRLAEHTSRQPTALLGELASGWKDVSRHGKLDATVIDGLPTIDEQAPSPNRVLWRARNDRSHRTQTRTHDRAADEELFTRLLPIVEWSIEQLFLRSDLHLYRLLDDEHHGGLVLRMSGARPSFDFVPEPAPPGLAVSPVVLASGGRSIALHPFFAPLSAGPWRAGDDPVGLVDGWSAANIVVLGVRTAVYAPELVAPLEAAFASKRARASTGDARAERYGARWREAAARTLAQLTPRKYVPATYVERPDVDAPLRALRSGDKQALLALGDAGAGKSSLVARFVGELLSTTEDAVAFLSGKGAFNATGRDGDACLGVAVGRPAKIDEKRCATLGDVARLFQQSDPAGTTLLWIVLDALNEADRFGELVSAVDRFLAQLAEHPRVRLVITMRAGSYESLAARHRAAGYHGPPVFENEDAFVSVRADARPTRPFLRVRPFDERELERAYDLHRLRRPDHACAAFGEVPATTRQLLATPLWMHVFHETFSDKKVVPTLDEAQLVDAYLEHLRTQLPSSEGWLRRAAKAMLDSSTPRIDESAAQAWRDDFRTKLGYPAWLAKLDPIEELIAASVLTPLFSDDGDVLGYGFVHQRLAEGVLLDSLRKRISGRPAPTGAELAALATSAAQSRERFPELTGALGGWCRQLVLTHPAIVATLATLPDAATRDALLGFAVDELATREPVPAEKWRAFLTTFEDEDSVAAATHALLARTSANMVTFDAARELSMRDATVMLLSGANDSEWAREILAHDAEGRASLHERAFAVGGPAPDQSKVLRDLLVALEQARAAISRSPGRDDLLVRLFRLAAAVKSKDPSQAVEVGQNDLAAVRDRLILRTAPTPRAERARAQLLQQLGEAANELGMRDLAHETFAAAVASLRQLRASSADATTSGRLARALAHLGKTTGIRGELPLARRLVLEALELTRSLSGTDRSIGMLRDYALLIRLARHPRIRGAYVRTLDALAPKLGAARMTKNVEPLPLGVPTCPRCAWNPASSSRWSCTCGHTWNTFTTGGVCPVCEHAWETTTCLSCRESSAHAAWYVT